jgi:biotin operon repressor
VWWLPVIEIRRIVMLEEEERSLEQRGRIYVEGNEGLLTEEDLSLLLDLSKETIVKYIDEGRLPGCRIGPQNSRVRTLTSVKQLIEFVEKKSKVSET